MVSIGYFIVYFHCIINDVYSVLWYGSDCCFVLDLITYLVSYDFITYSFVISELN